MAHDLTYDVTCLGWYRAVKFYHNVSISCSCCTIQKDKMAPGWDIIKRNRRESSLVFDTSGGRWVLLLKNWKIEQHNLCRKQSFYLEKKLFTCDWSRQFILSLLGIFIVYSWSFYFGISCINKVNQNQYQINLLMELIYNWYYKVYWWVQMNTTVPV